MTYEVQLKNLPAETIATERVHTTIAELGARMRQSLHHVATELTPAHAMRGAPFAIFYNEPFSPSDIDVELGVPVTRDAAASASAHVNIRQIPSGTFACTMHHGSYESIGAAYSALYAWLAEHGRKAAGPPREVYLVGPGSAVTAVSPARAADYVTAIEVPIT